MSGITILKEEQQIMLSKEQYEVTVGVNNILQSLSIVQEVLQQIIISVEEINTITKEDCQDILEVLGGENKILEASTNELLGVLVKCGNLKRDTKGKTKNRVFKNLSFN